MNSLVILGRSPSEYGIEPMFAFHVIQAYWSSIVKAFPVVKGEVQGDQTFASEVNAGCTPDLLLAVSSDPKHPLNVDWIFFLFRRIAVHPWESYGDNTMGFNQLLLLAEAIGESGRLNEHVTSIPELYEVDEANFNSYPNSAPILNRLYGTSFVISLITHPKQEYSQFTLSDKAIHNSPRLRQISELVNVGLYGINNAYAKKMWEVESFATGKTQPMTTVAIADKATLAIRQAGGKGTHHVSTALAPSWYQEGYREPVLIRFSDDIWFCTPTGGEDHQAVDMHCLDTLSGEWARVGRNGHSVKQQLLGWNLRPVDQRFRKFFHPGEL